MIRTVKNGADHRFSHPKNIRMPKIGHLKWINEEKKVDFNLFFIRNQKFTFSLVAEAGGGQILQNVIFCDLLDPTDHLKWDSDVPHEKSPIVPTLVIEIVNKATASLHLQFLVMFKKRNVEK